MNSLLRNDKLYHIEKLNLYNIVILRKNIFNNAISLAVAKTKNEWFDYKDMSVITIEEKFFIECLYSYLVNLRLFKENKWNLKYNEVIFYEDLTFNPVVDFSNLNFCNTKNLKNIKLPNNFKKSPSKKDTVRNYDTLYNIAVSNLKTYANNLNLGWLSINDVCIIDCSSFQ